MLTASTPDGYDLQWLAAGGKREVESLLVTKFNEMNAELSPDGRWLAYQSNESGQSEIYARPFPDVQAGRWQVSAAGGTRALWARSGKELFFLAPDGAVMAVPISGSAAFSAANPTKLFAGRYYAVLNGRTFDISPDDTRFLMIKEAAGSNDAPARLIVVENWFEELKRRVPVH